MHHLGSFLQMPCVVFLDVVPGSDGDLQLISHHHAWSLGGRPADEEHHTCACVWESSLRKRKKHLGFTSAQDLPTT